MQSGIALAVDEAFKFEFVMKSDADDTFYMLAKRDHARDNARGREPASPSA
jgi:hypothetical protein